MHCREVIWEESFFPSNATSSKLSYSLQAIHIAQHSLMEDITHFCPWPHSDCSASSTLQLFDIHENAIFQTICIMSCLFNKVKKKSSGEKRNTIKMNPTDHLPSLLLLLPSQNRQEWIWILFVEFWGEGCIHCTHCFCQTTVWLYLALCLKFWHIVSCSESLFLLHDEVPCSTSTTKHICS